MSEFDFDVVSDANPPRRRPPQPQPQGSASASKPAAAPDRPAAEGRAQPGSRAA
jgi:hypothetical protein